MPRPDQAALGEAAARPGGNAQGFTLMETLVVMATVATLAALASPSVGAGVQRHRLVSAAETLASDVSEARLSAAQQGHPLVVQAKTQGPDAPWCWTVKPGSDAAASSAKACLPQHRHHGVSSDSHPGVKMLLGQDVTLLPDGTAKGGTVAVFESAHGQRLRVDLLTLGRSRICTLPHADGTAPSASQLGTAMLRYAQCA